jgi:hypothetical protein
MYDRERLEASVLTQNLDKCGHDFLHVGSLDSLRNLEVQVLKSAIVLQGRYQSQDAFFAEGI